MEFQTICNVLIMSSHSTRYVVILLQTYLVLGIIALLVCAGYAIYFIPCVSIECINKCSSIKYKKYILILHMRGISSLTLKIDYFNRQVMLYSLIFENDASLTWFALLF